MYYEDEAIIFILTAYSLLREYEFQPSHQNDCVKHYLSKELPKGYVLKISDRGRLVLCKKYSLHTSTNYTYETVTSHPFNGKHSQITYIGKLLAVYLESLQKDEKEKSNE